MDVMGDDAIDRFAEDLQPLGDPFLNHSHRPPNHLVAPLHSNPVWTRAPPPHQHPSGPINNPNIGGFGDGNFFPFEQFNARPPEQTDVDEQSTTTNREETTSGDKTGEHTSMLCFEPGSFKQENERVMLFSPSGFEEHSMHSELSTPNTDCSSGEIPCETSWNVSNISLLLEALNCNDEDILITTLGELQQVADESGTTDSFGDWCDFLSPLCNLIHSSGLLTEFMDLLAILYWKSPPFVRSSLSSEIPSFILNEFGDWSNCPALESCCSCMESLFFDPETVNSLFLQNKNLIVSIFDKIGESPLSSPVLTTLASLSLFPHLRIAFSSLRALCTVIKRDPTAFTLLPSPIFPSSSPYSQYAGLSFLDALIQKLRSIFSTFQASLPIDRPHFQDYIKPTTGDSSSLSCLLGLCTNSCSLLSSLHSANPSIFIEPEIIRDFLLFVTGALQTVLSSISSIDEFIAFPDPNLPLTLSDTPQASGVYDEMSTSLRILRDECVNFVDAAWLFFANKKTLKAIPRKSSFTSTVLEPQPFCENVIRSLKLNNPNTGHNIIITINRILSRIPQMKESFISANLVERMFKTFDFASLPLSESQFHWDITRFVGLMIQPIMKDKETYPTQRAIFRVSVFEPVRQHVGFVLHNWKTLTFGSADTTQQESCVCLIVGIAKDMELESDELDSGFVSELVRWEVRMMVEIENEKNINRVIQRIGNMIWMWKLKEKERLKRREVLLREEGWDDVFELRVVGIELDTEQYRQLHARQFRIETRTLQQTTQTAVILRRMSSFNADRR
ncbi:hypothetical protein BLNAU_15284 [Blattamonas nauphoetae]|uniref:Uncharacterized protein n=1 Tax=Blattamonas nauphoetae TaxID=2049346 RepID=A0ABQ9XEP5_9EUKA|nr:hypothetical protein BLNAU_15284 [Blattamonas nauphoetae]